MTAASRKATPLGYLRVLELGAWVAAPYAGKILADLGAQVLKLEYGDGDPTRRWGPFPTGAEDDPERSGMFAYLNTGKQSRRISPADDGMLAVSEVHELVAGCDVVIVDQHFLARLPSGFLVTLADAFPQTIVATVTPFGTDGPYASYRGHDINCSAAGGTAYGVGEPERAPLPVPLSQSEHQAGIALAIAILMALKARERDGLGQRVDVATAELVASLHTAYFLPRYLYDGGIVGRRAGAAGGTPLYPNTVLRCRDGRVVLSAPEKDQWIRFVALMGDPEWSLLPRYRNRRAMLSEYKEEVDQLIEPWLMSYSKAELYDAFLANRIPCAPVHTGQDLLTSDHLNVRGALTTIELPGGGQCRAPSPPYRFSNARVDVRRAPELGENAWSPEPAADTSSRISSADAAVSAPPLQGLRVLDFGTAWAGGLAGRFLGDYGADVIKVESWSHMDGSRKGRPIVVDDESGGDAGRWPDMQPGFHVHGRSKRSITVNLKTEAGRRLVLDLAKSADVVLSNSPAGVMERLGLAADDLLAVNPRLVVTGQSIAGYSGPSAGYIGYAGGMCALSGFASTVGYEGEPPIGMFQGLHSDVISALTTVLATLAALVHRASTGLGQAVEVSQWEATMALAEEVILTRELTGEELGSMGFRHPLLCPQGIYPCRSGADDDPYSAWVSLAVGSDEEWRSLVAVLAREESSLPCSASSWSMADRRSNRTQIDAAISSWTKGKDRYDVARALQAEGVAAFAVQSIADIFVDPQMHFRQAFVDLEHPLVGVEPMSGLAWKLERTPGEVVAHAPLLGADNRTVLLDGLGLSEAEFEALITADVIETADN